MHVRDSVMGQPKITRKEELTGWHQTGPKIHGLQNDQFNREKKVIQMGPNLLSPESLKNTECVGKKEIKN